MVWRISERAPFGEWVDPEAPPQPERLSQTDLPEVSTNGGWLVSSFDLLSGTDVEEVETAVPGELFDEMFPSPDKKRPKS
ncbi:putative protein OS=Rhizobacter sp OX=1909292 GN=H7Z15_11550 PE=4 SV=1 [Rhizobacter fulvus]